MSDAQIKHMVERFLNWRLPEDFAPDAGISFKADYNESTPWPAKHEPVGTNLFDYSQATEMVRFMLDGMPQPLANAARELVDSRSDDYKARNGRRVSIQDENGEKMWLVPFDEMAALEAALRAALQSHPQEHGEPK